MYAVMHVTTETEHPQHIAEIDGVGLTETGRKVVEALCRHEDMSTADITDTLGLDRTTVWRSLQRLEDANVVKSREKDVELTGTARKPLVWSLTNKALSTDVAERLRVGSTKPLDPVEEREERIQELEKRVKELEARLDTMEDDEWVIDDTAHHEDGW